MIVTQWGLHMRRGVPLQAFSFLRVCVLNPCLFAFPGLMVLGAEDRKGKIYLARRARPPTKHSVHMMI